MANLRRKKKITTSDNCPIDVDMIEDEEEAEAEIMEGNWMRHANCRLLEEL